MVLPRAACCAAPFLLISTLAFAVEPLAYVETAALGAPEAVQAAAADERHIYAIDNRRIARYDRKSGQRLAESEGEALHLNSGFLWQGTLYCAHSNYPRTPASSVLKALDLETMKLTDAYDFGERYGSLTWAVHHDGNWWCNFAHYGPENAKTVLVRFTGHWQELARYSYPPQVIADLGTFSISGGVWLDDYLLTTGHDKRKIYRLELPTKGGLLQLIDTVPVPFPGQGIAVDPVTGGLVGIDRARRRVVFATLERRP